MMKWYEYIWLPPLKPYITEYRGAYTISNYTQADCALHSKYVQRKIFWVHFFNL